jgi:hypothetical protein
VTKNRKNAAGQSNRDKKNGISWFILKKSKIVAKSLFCSDAPIFVVITQHSARYNYKKP